MSLEQRSEIRLLVIVFSFNRAMQLDHVLRQLFKHLLIRDFQVAVVYHTTGDHQQGYTKLRAQYEQSGSVSFFERQSLTNFTQVLPLLVRPRNLYRYLKYKQLRTKLDDFKWLLESVLQQSTWEFVMFSSDDTFLYKDTRVPSSVVQSMREAPADTSFRIYVGNNIVDVPVMLENHGDALAWNYYDKRMYHHWAYPFAVDGTIFARDPLLRLLRPVLYHNPSTLEGFMCKQFILHKAFRNGFSPLESTMVSMVLNTVQTVSNNATGSIGVDYLNQKWLEGYMLDFELPARVTQPIMVPEKAILRRGSEMVTLENVRSTSCSDS